MVLSQKKIALILCGSLASNPGEEVPSETVRYWLESLTGVDLLAEISVDIVDTRPGMELTYDVWQKLATTIAAKYDLCDGFVVIHSPDNLLRGIHTTAFMLGQVGKPVVYTTTPLTDQDSPITPPPPPTEFKGVFGGYFNLGLEANIVNAVQFAVTSAGCHAFVFGNTTFPALRTYQVESSEAQLYDAMDKDYWAVMEMGLNAGANAPRGKGRLPDIQPNLETNIEVVAAIDLPQAVERWQQSAPPRGLIIKLEDTGNLSQQNKDFLESYVKQGGVPGVLLPPGDIDEAKLNYAAVRMQGLQFDTAVAKFRWVLGQTKDLKTAQALFSNNRSGEFARQIDQALYESKLESPAAESAARALQPPQTEATGPNAARPGPNVPKAVDGGL